MPGAASGLVAARKASGKIRPAAVEAVRPEERAERLKATRNLKMARSAHAYVRGNTVKFYEWLDGGPAGLPQGPAIWICGDCHLGNLGPLADMAGRVAVQIRDLDQTVIGNPVHDLVRLALSLASAARGCDLPGVTTARAIEHLMSGYEAGIAGDFDKAGEKALRSSDIDGLIRQSVRRRWRHLATERLESIKAEMPLGKRFWALGDDERDAIEALFQTESSRTLLSALRAGQDADTITLVDAAYWMKGCSSLGRLRYAAMVRIGSGADASLALVDLKEATAAAAPRDPHAVMPRDNAARVVAGARALSPHLGERMVATRLRGAGFVLRELMPQDLKLEIGQLTPKRMMGLAAYLGAVVGNAHGRQLDEADRDAWLRELARARTKSLDAPSWLWSSVVDLLAIHERGYLEHCRQYALAHAA